MRKQWHWAVLLLLLCLFPGHMKAEEPAGWTVMFYFCGSDLESKYGFASENLMEITECLSPSSMLPELAWLGCSWNRLTSLDVTHNPALCSLAFDNGDAQGGNRIGYLGMQSARWKRQVVHERRGYAFHVAGQERPCALLRG